MTRRLLFSAALLSVALSGAWAEEPAPPAPGPNDLPPAPEVAAPALRLPEARLDAKAVMVTDKRIEVSAQWTSDEGPLYLETVTLFFLKDDGTVTREIPFDIRDTRVGFSFSRRVPLEPKADLFGICAVYGASKDAARARLSALFLNKGDGERSDMRGAPSPSADQTGGCFAFSQ